MALRGHDALPRGPRAGQGARPLAGTHAEPDRRELCRPHRGVPELNHGNHGTTAPVTLAHRRQCHGRNRRSRRRTPRPPRRAEASRRKSVHRSGEAKRSHQPSPLRCPAFSGLTSYLGGGGKKRSGEEQSLRRSVFFFLRSSPVRLDRGSGRKRRELSAGVAGAFS